jgi:hypothetical protein
MITIPDNPTLEWAEEQADKLVLAQWAIFKELSELALLSDKLQLAELEIFAVYLVSGRRSYPKKPGDWPGITDRQAKERIDELSSAEGHIRCDLGELAMLASGEEPGGLPPGEHGKLMQHLLRFWTQDELGFARGLAETRRLFEATESQQEAPGAPAAVLDPGRAGHRPVGGTAGTVTMIDPEELVQIFEGAWWILKLIDVEREAQRSYLRYLAVRQDWKALRDFAERIEEDCLEDEGVDTWLTNEVEKLLKLVGEEPEP